MPVREEKGPQMDRGLVIEWLGGNCPVQAEGTFDSQPFYFRARGGSVTCDVGDWTWDGPEYEWPDAGWISERLAEAYIHEAYAAWKSPRPAGQIAEYRRRNGIEAEVMHAIRFAALAERELGNAAKPVSEWAMRYAAELKARAALSKRQGESE